MEWSMILMLAIAALVILFPLAYIWFVCIGGICMAFKKRKAAMPEDMTCSIDVDCPPGYICMNGHCVPQNT